MPYLKGSDGRVVILPGRMTDEDQLDEHVTASLCRRIGIPPELFGLAAEESDGDDFEIGLDGV
jgi:hypothetical protein